ncbi:MAG: serine/threonine protein kinase [Myxococcales bacterium]|nr:serine/threonine protein kinase [Myxococcales bacterium]
MEFDATIGVEGAAVAPEVPPHIGRYRVLRELGRGAMGIVLLAHDPALDRELALKVLIAPEDAQNALLAEAQTMARLSHPNVVSVHDVGQHDGRTFVAMERIVGVTLRSWLEQRRRHVVEILDLFAQAGDGLTAAHQAGLVHCDFKPDNVFVGDDGRVRVGDFGLATRTWSESRGGSGPARRTGIFGTPAYMSPEQAEGASIDARSDQFSFCVALFEALHGVAPFGGDTFSSRREALRAARLVVTEPLVDLPEAVEDVLRRGLSSRPDDRFPTMEALLVALRAARRRGGLMVPSVERCDALWRAGAKDAIRQRFDAVGLRFVTHTFQHVARHIEQHLGAWRSACRDAESLVAEDPFWYADALAHSERAFQELAAFVGVLEHGDPTEFASAYRGELPLRCLREYSLPESTPVASPRPPRAPARRRVAELVRNLSIRASMLSVLRSPSALTLANDAVIRAEQLGDAPTLAEALHVAGAATVLSGQRQEHGLELLERALVVADDAGYTLGSALSAIELARAHVGLLAGVPTARQGTGAVASLLDSARSALRRLGSPLRPETELASVQAAWLMRSGDAASALQVVSLALSRLEQAYGDSAPERVPLLLRRALISAQASDPQAALQDSTLAVEILTSALGPDHPGTAQALDFHGHFLMVAGRLPEARVIYDRLASVLDGTPRIDAVRRAWCDHKRGEIAVHGGDLEAAVAWFDRSLGRYKAISSTLHWNAIVGPMDYLTLTTWLCRDLDRARDFAEQAWTSSQGMSPPPSFGRFVRAALMAEDGHGDAAQAALDAIAEQKEIIPGAMGGLTMSVDVWRGRAFRLSGHSREAIECLERAMVTVDPICEREVVEVMADMALARMNASEPFAEDGLRAVIARAESAGLASMPYLEPVRTYLAHAQRA